MLLLQEETHCKTVLQVERLCLFLSTYQVLAPGLQFHLEFLQKDHYDPNAISLLKKKELTVQGEGGDAATCLGMLSANDVHSPSDLIFPISAGIRPLS